MILRSESDSDTRRIGRELGQVLKPGDIVCLYGDLGAGKTTMVKGIASALGIDERDITSASFTIIAEYDTDVPFYHIDLYRIAPGGAAEIGLHEYLGSDGIAVIEWAERAEEEMPDNRIMITLNYLEDSSREIEVKGIEL